MIVMSDHGHGPIYWWIHLNNLLAREGCRVQAEPRDLGEAGAVPPRIHAREPLPLKLALDRRGRKKKGAPRAAAG